MEKNDLFNKKCKDAYIKLRNNNLLIELYPHLRGIWSIDKEKWKEEYKKMIITNLKK